MDDPIQQFRQWYTSKPVVTRTYLTGAFLLSVAVSLGIVSPFSLYYTFNQTVFDLQLWRPATALFFQGKFSFGFLFSMYFCYFAIAKLETEIFTKETFPDFLWLCMVLYTALIVVASVLPLYYIGDGFVFAMIYIWCKRKPFETIRLMFGFQVKSGYFPWVYMGFQVLMGSSILIYLAGLLLGHLYIVVKDIFLPKYHKDYLPTPRFLTNLIAGRRQRAERFAEAPRNVFAGRGVRIN